MHILPIHTEILKEGDDLANILADKFSFEDDDIVVLSSKAVATVEGAAIDLSTRSVSPEATDWSQKTGRSPQFCQAVLEEIQRCHGTVVGFCPGALLTELSPDGLSEGSILTANAGLDESNIVQGFTAGYPLDPVISVHRLRAELQKLTGKKLAVIISDSCCRPRRWGITAFALTASGISPFQEERGKEDLFGRKLRMTTEAIADQLATAANFLMGNASQAIPAAVARDHGLAMTDFEGWVRAIDRDEDLFRGSL